MKRPVNHRGYIRANYKFRDDDGDDDDDDDDQKIDSITVPELPRTYHLRESSTGYIPVVYRIETECKVHFNMYTYLYLPTKSIIGSTVRTSLNSVSRDLA